MLAATSVCPFERRSFVFLGPLNLIFLAELRKEKARDIATTGARKFFIACFVKRCLFKLRHKQRNADGLAFRSFWPARFLWFGHDGSIIRFNAHL